MTTVDWIEALIFIILSRLALVSMRVDFIIVFAILLGSLIWGRTAIALTSPVASVLLCVAYQGLACLAFTWRAQGVAGMVIGSLFGMQVIDAGLTMIGVLSPETSNGPSLNFWTFMTTASILQDLALIAAYYLAGDLWLDRQKTTG